ncbi:MAG: hypothetical protein ACFCUR_09745 [Rhodomicrobiaceae bacterium]
MAKSRILYQSARFTITENALRTPRKTYALKDIDYVQIKRPVFILGVVLGGLLLAWAAMFWDLLHAGERLSLLMAPVLAIVIASRLGTLVVHSWSLRGGELEEAVIWDIATVRAIREALDTAMLERADHKRQTVRGEDSEELDGEGDHAG